MIEDFDPALLIGKTVKSVEPLKFDAHAPSRVASRTDTEGIVVVFTDGTRLELGAGMGQGCGYIIADVIKGGA